MPIVKSQKSANKKPSWFVVRCDRSGAFVAQIKDQSADGKRATLIDSRRLWYWSGASSLCQLALEGVKRPSQCKFPAVVPSRDVTDIIEVIPMTDAAKSSVDQVSVWAQ